MAGKKPITAVIKIDQKDPQAVCDKGDELVATGVYANNDVYDKPTVKKEDFVPALKEAKDLIIAANANPKLIKERDESVARLYAMIVLLHDYVYPISKGNIVLVDKSGFAANSEDKKHSKPNKEVIKSVGPAKEKGKYKIALVRKQIKKNENPDPVTHMRGVKFNIEISLTPEVESSWAMIAGGLTSTNLVFSKYTSLVKNWVRVYGTNSAGDGQTSEPFAFLPM